MTTLPDAVPHVAIPADARVLHAFGDTLTFLLTAEHTGGRYTAFIDEVPPGGGPPLHRHHHEDEWFYILDGRVEFCRDGQWSAPLSPGALVFMPRGSVHTFRNPGPDVARMLIHLAPAGFENFMAACADHFATHNPPDPAVLTAIAAHHGIDILPPPDDQ